MDKDELLTKLKKLKTIATTRYQAKELALFGSFVRGEQSADSDIDVLVEFEDGADLFDLIGLSFFLAESLQRKVDIVPQGALRAELRERVLQEAIAL